jgi:alpha-D-xyloside xylohydrolase
MRALISDFPSDKKVWNLCDEFMFGQSILATPIVKSQYTDEQVIKEDAMTGWNKRNNTPDASDEYKPIDFTATKEYQKYLPKGAKWYYFWTNKLYDGGQKVNIQTSIDQVPMFVRAGSILPIGPAMQYIGQKPWDNLEIRVYPGADATFTLYEDEGDSYDYEKGIFSTIEFHWNEKKHQLIITDRKGQYPGMLQKRKFNIQLVGTSLQKTIEYDGSEKIVEL